MTIMHVIMTVKHVTRLSKMTLHFPLDPLFQDLQILINRYHKYVSSKNINKDMMVLYNHTQIIC